MTLNDYLNFNESEKADYLKLISDNLIFSGIDWNGNADSLRSLINVEEYYAARKVERKKTTVAWPEFLSLKERVLCRLKMLGLLLSKAIVSSEIPDYSIIKKSCETVINSIVNDIFKYGMDPELKKVKWPGLEPSVVDLLNCIYDKTIRLYEKEIYLLDSKE